MTVLVEPYRLRESQRSTTAQCTECEYPPAWEIRQQTERGSVGFACSQHVDTVLFLVETGRVPKNTSKTEG